MRIFLITPYGKDYLIAGRVMADLLTDDTLEEDVSVYNPATLYASPDAPVGNHLLLRETLPKLLDADAVLYLPGWMSDPMALMHASIAQAINLVQWIPSDPLPVVTDNMVPVLVVEDEEYDWDYGSLQPLYETEDAPLHRDSGDEHKPQKGT